MKLPGRKKAQASPSPEHLLELADRHEAWLLEHCPEAFEQLGRLCILIPPTIGVGHVLQNEKLTLSGTYDLLSKSFYFAYLMGTFDACASLEGDSLPEVSDLVADEVTEILEAWESAEGTDDLVCANALTRKLREFANAEYPDAVERLSSILNTPNTYVRIAFGLAAIPPDTKDPAAFTVGVVMAAWRLGYSRAMFDAIGDDSNRVLKNSILEVS